MLTLKEKVQVCIKHLENEQDKLAHNILIMKEAEDTYNKENTDYEDLKKHAGGESVQW